MGEIVSIGERHGEGETGYWVMHGPLSYDLTSELLTLAETARTACDLADANREIARLTKDSDTQVVHNPCSYPTQEQDYMPYR